MYIGYHPHARVTKSVSGGRVILVRVAVLTLIRHAVVIVGSKYTHRIAAAYQAAIFSASENGEERKRGKLRVQQPELRAGTGSWPTALAILPSKSIAKPGGEAFPLPRAVALVAPFPFLQSNVFI